MYLSISVVNHALVHSRKCLTYMMLEENPLFHAAAVQIAERVPSELQSPVYGELYCLLTVGDMYATDGKVFRIGTVRYNWPMSAHASQAFSIAHSTDSEDLLTDDLGLILLLWRPNL